MKKLIVLCAALLVLPASSAFAQLDVTWDNCVVPLVGADAHSPANAKVFNCALPFPQFYRLYGCFKVPVDLPGFFAMDISMDLSNDTNTPLTPFWHFEAGPTGCNNTGLSLSPIDFSSATDCFAYYGFSPWGITGSEATGGGSLSAYGPDYLGQPGRGRALAGLARSSTSAFPLSAGVNYIAFVMTFSTANHATCSGCTDNMVIVWNSATLYSNDGHLPVVLTGPDKKDFFSCGLINNVASGVCTATPTRNTTWGQLKSIYR